MRYNEKQIENVGKHDFNELTEVYENTNSISVGVFKWVLKANKKSMKPTKAVVRVSGKPQDYKLINKRAAELADLLDSGVRLGFKSKKV